MGADQFDEFEPKERSHKLSFFNWWFFSIFFGTLFSNTFLVYIQDKVLVAAGRKWKVHVLDDPKELHELNMEDYASNGRNRIDHSSALSFLDKAAIKTGQTSSWMLCTVTQVEETKQMIKMIPILITTIIPSTLIVQASTLFIKQGTTLNRRMGPHFEIPPASLTSFITIFMLLSIVPYDRLFVPAIRRYTKNPRGITMLQRLGIGIKNLLVC
ncbi:protein NRT1/ PTR FAMILY 5.2-like isoform X2 [Gastrolobium bilobum]|uniref:protein NRT1/ PTR FAMILY 5.2-like isoform X2 n=1 Tax=Gastrolobium bilobum TaxID=150636 RepID=UPI002AAF74B5|nr:protein NRT1/ PTR FAMILY 5.2-like isoform X2 [Gastrolobium bilobum]